MTGIQIAWEDVWSVASQISGWLIGIGVVLAAMIALLIFAGKMRQATKNILYTVVNSSTYTQENYEAAIATPGWIKTTYIVDAIGIVVLLAAEAVLIISGRKKSAAR